MTAVDRIVQMTCQATNVMQQRETVVEKVVKIWQETTMRRIYNTKIGMMTERRNSIVEEVMKFEKKNNHPSNGLPVDKV